MSADSESTQNYIELKDGSLIEAEEKTKFLKDISKISVSIYQISEPELEALLEIREWKSSSIYACIHVLTTRWTQ